MTASYVYSRPERVAPGTAAKVRAAAERLGYPGPHPGARSLRRGRAGSLGVILGERLTYAFDDPQAARFLAGVAEVCAAEGVGLTLVPTTGAASDVQRVADAVVDGFIVWTTSDDDPVLDAVAASGLPSVVHAGPHRRGLPVVGIDDRAAAAAIGRLGRHRRRRSRRPDHRPAVTAGPGQALRPHRPRPAPARRTAGSPGLAGDPAHEHYGWERRGRNLIQARMATATSSHGENKMCTAKVRTAKATMATTARAMIASMMFGLLVVVAVMLQGCRRPWLRSIGISPVRTLMCSPGHQGQP